VFLSGVAAAVLAPWARRISSTWSRRKVLDYLGPGIGVDLRAMETWWASMISSLRAPWKADHRGEVHGCLPAHRRRRRAIAGSQSAYLTTYRAVAARLRPSTSATPPTPKLASGLVDEIGTPSPMVYGPGKLIRDEDVASYRGPTRNRSPTAHQRFL
jgi:hypothetical protein